MKASGTDFLTILFTHQDIVHKINLVYFKTQKARKENFLDIVYQLWESFPSLGEKEEKICWLYAIAFNTSLSLMKKKRKQFAEKFAHYAEDNRNLSDNFKSLLSAIRNLHATDRAIILLYLEDHTYSQISDIVGVDRAGIEGKIERIRIQLQQRNDIKVIWQNEVSAALIPYCEHELARMIERSTRITIRNSYPVCILSSTLLFSICYLAWKAITKTYNIPLAIFYMALIFLLLCTLLFTGWSARRMRTYPSYFSLKEWLKYYIDWIEQSMQFRRKYEAALYVGILLLGGGITALYSYLENQTFNIISFLGITFIIAILLYTRTQIMNGRYCKTRRFLENLYKQL